MNKYIRGIVCEDRRTDGVFHIKFRAISDYKEHDLVPFYASVLKKTIQFN